MSPQRGGVSLHSNGSRFQPEIQNCPHESSKLMNPITRRIRDGGCTVTKIGSEVWKLARRIGWSWESKEREFGSNELST